MSLSQGLPNYLSTSGVLGTRVQGPLIAGQASDGGTATGPLVKPSGVMVVQSTASLTNQIVTTSDSTIGNRASFIYIPVSTATLVGAVAPPYVGCGTPIVWNDVVKTLMVWSSGAASWMSLVVTSSTIGTAPFSSS